MSGAYCQSYADHQRRGSDSDALHAELERQRARAEKLEKALGGLWALIEEGALVRNVTHDAEAGYAREAMRLVMALKHAQEALTPEAQS